ncbi:GntR family transcriptional regulator [Tessaracoccus sp. OH4464_COT-324]|uniref:GntR family transcriptional regulator n=1 Tax=Tessaracoccus sp. OH4464_COT-324 TaxID=2491059 RepID=UPI000F6385B0|nr:GntR family transcriptional regulator [Tessaracoccus sp. OH4464_COT-324]RRD46477.1 GntR family transcriptional regulator [Tessaracoccus sp. OH4464_COT-324]
MRIVLSNTSGQPIYEQIARQAKSAILSGELAEGHALPSIRALAKDLRVSVITTKRAYDELVAEGFVANVPGKGCYVLPVNRALVRESVLRDIEALLAEAAVKARTAGIGRAEMDEIWQLAMEE